MSGRARGRARGEMGVSLDAALQSTESPSPDSLVAWRRLWPTRIVLLLTQRNGVAADQRRFPVFGSLTTCGGHGPTWTALPEE